MKKLPLVAALAAASICTVAGAQSVQVYGKLYPYVEQENSSGQTAAGTSTSTLAPAAITGLKTANKVRGMSAGNSNIGFRGFEDLGGGMKAEFQYETVVSVDNGAGFATPRNTFVGLQSPFGEVRLGIMDTVFKEYGDTIGILGISSGTPVSSSNILRKIAFGTSNNARFHERRANSIRYDSPEVSGFQVGAQVATQEAALAGGAGSAKTYSFGLKYDNGPIYAAIAYELHKDWYGGSSNVRAAQSNLNTGVHSEDSAIQAAVEYRFTSTQKVEFDVITKKYDEKAVTTGKFRNYKNTSYMIAYDGRFGPVRLMAHLVKAQAGSCTLVNTACSTDGLAGSQLTLGTAYSLSRRTYLFAAYSKMTNGTAGRYSALDLNSGVSQGEDSTHVLAGIAHSF
jgi:predicted porin